MPLKFKILMLFILMTFLLGCDKMPPLSGTITTTKGGEWSPVVYLNEPQNWSDVASSFTGNVVDSAKMDAKGHFAFDKMPNTTEQRLFELAIQKKGGAFYPNRLENDDPNTSNYCPIVYKNGEILVVKTDAAHLQRNFVIEKPSAETEPKSGQTIAAYSSATKYSIIRCP